MGASNGFEFVSYAPARTNRGRDGARAIRAFHAPRVPTHVASMGADWMHSSVAPAPAHI